MNPSRLGAYRLVVAARVVILIAVVATAVNPLFASLPVSCCCSENEAPELEVGGRAAVEMSGDSDGDGCCPSERDSRPTDGSDGDDDDDRGGCDCPPACCVGSVSSPVMMIGGSAFAFAAGGPEAASMIGSVDRPSPHLRRLKRPPKPRDFA